MREKLYRTGRPVTQTHQSKTSQPSRTLVHNWCVHWYTIGAVTLVHNWCVHWYTTMVRTLVHNWCVHWCTQANLKLHNTSCTLVHNLVRTLVQQLRAYTGTQSGAVHWYTPIQNSTTIARTLVHKAPRCIHWYNNWCVHWYTIGAYTGTTDLVRTAGYTPIQTLHNHLAHTGTQLGNAYTSNTDWCNTNAFTSILVRTPSRTHRIQNLLWTAIAYTGTLEVMRAPWCTRLVT